MDPISRISPTGAPDPIELAALAALRRVGAEQRGQSERERKRRRPELEPEADGDPDLDLDPDLDRSRRKPGVDAAADRRGIPPQRPAGGRRIDISA